MENNNIDPSTSSTHPSNVFFTIPLRENIIIHPSALSADVNEMIYSRLVNKFEGICSHNGYILKNSIKIQNISNGTIRSFTLNGDVEYIVDFVADVCNPYIGSLIEARVANINRFGALAEVYVEDAYQKTTIMEIVIPRVHITTLPSGEQESRDESGKIDALHVGTLITAVVLGKRFQLNDTKQSILARLATADEIANHRLEMSNAEERLRKATLGYGDDADGDVDMEDDDSLSLKSSVDDDKSNASGDDVEDDLDEEDVLDTEEIEPDSD